MTAFLNERNGKTVIVNDGLDDIFYVGELDFAKANYYSKHIPDFNAGDQVASSYKDFYFRIKYGTYAVQNWKYWLDSGPNWGKISGQIILSMEGIPISHRGEGEVILKLTKGVIRAIGNLTNLKDITVAEAVIARGGKLDNLGVIDDIYKSMKVGEIANKAAQGDEKAITALKIIKQASSKAQKY